jgi:hypothetical protein
LIFGHCSSSRVNIQIGNHNNATSRSCRIGDDVRKFGTDPRQRDCELIPLE